MKRKEKCPKCGIKMKKKWVMHSLGLPNTNRNKVYEREAKPEFICKKCGYKIEAIFDN